MQGLPGLLHAYIISPEGTSREVTMKEAAQHDKDDGVLWIHMHTESAETRTWLEDSTDLDPIIIDAMLRKETRPRIIKRNDGVMIILRAMNLVDEDIPEDMISLRMWIDEHRIITTRRRDIKAIADILHCIERGNAPTTPPNFLIAITNRVFSRMEPFIEELEESISNTETQIAENIEPSLTDGIGRARMQAAIFKRYITPQKNVIESLLDAKFTWLADIHRHQLAEDLDRIIRYTEELAELHDRSQILSEEIRNIHAEKLNDSAYGFSVVATIFLPLSFLTGLMGINIGGMPGINSSDAFWLFAGLCLFLASAQIVIFKKLKWF